MSHEIRTPMNRATSEPVPPTNMVANDAKTPIPIKLIHEDLCGQD
jgi:hypothetical protein